MSTLHPLDLPHLPKLDSTAVDVARDAYEKAQAEFTRENNRRHADQPRLVYAARLRCKCGAGMAYRTDARFHGSWICSAILKTQVSGATIANMMAPGGEHTDPKPFMFFEITSELQPSANGATTRPPESTR